MAKKPRPLMQGIHGIMIQDVPSYANKFFYSLGFLSMISFILLLVTGTIMAFFGPGWWLTNSLGSYTRSVHLWATQAFVLFVLLHLMVVTFTSGYRRPRRLTWMLGVLMLFLVLAETEFGYVLRGDFSSQWRSRPRQLHQRLKLSANLRYPCCSDTASCHGTVVLPLPPCQGTGHCQALP